MSKMSGLHRKEQARLFCQGHAGKVRFYKKVLDEWIEPGDGTFVVRIKNGFSFDKEYEVREMVFNDVDKAMNSMHKVYAGTFKPIISSEQEPTADGELSDLEKLNLLSAELKAVRDNSQSNG